MIEIILVISVVLNIVLLTGISLSEDTTDFKLKNQRLQFENQILHKEYYKLKEVLYYLKDDDVKVDWSNEGIVVFYLPENNDMDELFNRLKESWDL